MLMLWDRTADVTYCADLTLFLHEMSGGLSLTAPVSLRPFFAFHCFKCYMASYSHVIFWRASQRVVRSLIIVNKSITENLIFYQFKTEFYFTCEHQTCNCIFTRGYRHSWKYRLWCSFCEIKFDLTLEVWQCSRVGPVLYEKKKKNQISSISFEKN